MTKRLKLYLLIAAAVVAVGSIIFARLDANKWRNEAYRLSLLQDSVIELSNGMQARLANRIIFEDSLREELQAAKELNAKLIASGRARVIFDTVLSEIVISDTSQVDSVFGSTFSDTMAVGILNGVVLAYPRTRHITLDYQLALDPLDISMSFYQTKGDSVFFAVKSSMGTAVLGTNYAGFRPPEKRFVKYVEGSYGMGAISWEARAGAGLNLGKGWQLSPELQALYIREQHTADGSLRVVLRKTF